MKVKNSIAIFFVVLTLLFISFENQSFQIQTVEEYNSSLIEYGFSWKGGYSPSFYTGFAPRALNPERIHIQVARGNQARTTVKLDEETVLTYLYQLKKREYAYKQLTDSGIISPHNTMTMDYFSQVVNNPDYAINELTLDYEYGKIDEVTLYNRSLDLLRKLNPNRVYHIKIDILNEIKKWEKFVNEFKADLSKKNISLEDTQKLDDYLRSDSKSVLILANHLLWGRIVLTQLDESQRSALIEVLRNFNSVNTISFFKSVAKSEFSFFVVRDEKFAPAIDCETIDKCELNYYEFTAIYPVGGYKERTTDSKGSAIPQFVTPGKRYFISRNYHDVDHIRGEAYYGWIPKIDFEGIGNGFHNPAVRTWLPSSTYKHLYEALNIPKDHNTLWIPARGGISSGCVRMGAGHLWEIRHIMPANPKLMEKIAYYGSKSQHYDVFDIDADGNPEVMGVDYFIAYGTKGSSGLNKREGKSLSKSSLDKDPFYLKLYGDKGQIRKSRESNYIIENPEVSYFKPNQGERKVTPYGRNWGKDLPLYEQSYEKDKIQLYKIKGVTNSTLSQKRSNNTNKAQQMVRIMGRIEGCGPFVNNFSNCFENRFDAELESLKENFE